MARTDRKVGYSPTGKLADVTPDMAAAGIEKACRMLEGRWKMVILFQLFARPVLRFSELERAIPKVSQKMLAQQLRELERDGLVERKVYAEVPPKVEYRLTDWGSALCPALDQLLEWLQRARPLGPGSRIAATDPDRMQSERSALRRIRSVKNFSANQSTYSLSITTVSASR